MYKYNMGGSVPRETTIGGQRHNLAYINPFEEDLLNTQYRGGEGQPMPPVAGPGGVPAYVPYNPGGSVGESAGEKKNVVSAFHKNLVNNASANKAPAKAPTYVDPFAHSAVPDDGLAAMGARTAANVDLANYQKQQPGTNSIPEMVANAFTGGDKLRYEGGELQYEVGHKMIGKKGPDGKIIKAGDSALDQGNLNSFGVEAGAFNDIGNDPGGAERFADLMGQTYKTPAKSTNIIDDVKMGYAAGFGSYEQMVANLQAAGYDDQTIQDYISRTKATQTRDAAGQLANITGGSDNNDPMAGTGLAAGATAIGGGVTPVVNDPCPEGYIMNPQTGSCELTDATNSGYLGLPSYMMPDPMVAVTDYSRPAVIGQPPLQPYRNTTASGTGGNFLQSSAPGLANTQANFNQGGPVGGIMDLLR